VSEPPVPTARRLARGTAALAICAAVLTACGGDDSADTQASTNSGSSSGGQTISLDQKGLTAGTYDIEVVNDGGATHDLVVEKDGKDIGKTDAIGPGKSTTLTVTLESGDYVFYCSIGNHREMGMETTVSVS
jgi:uncharacterized cupredoxin-like copper-binding protein